MGVGARALLAELSRAIGELLVSNRRLGLLCDVRWNRPHPMGLLCMLRGLCHDFAHVLPVSDKATARHQIRTLELLHKTPPAFLSRPIDEVSTSRATMSTWRGYAQIVDAEHELSPPSFALSDRSWQPPLCSPSGNPRGSTSRKPARPRSRRDRAWSIRMRPRRVTTRTLLSRTARQVGGPSGIRTRVSVLIGRAHG